MTTEVWDAAQSTGASAYYGAASSSELMSWHWPTAGAWNVGSDALAAGTTAANAAANDAARAAPSRPVRAAPRPGRRVALMPVNLGLTPAPRQPPPG